VKAFASLLGLAVLAWVLVNAYELGASHEGHHERMTHAIKREWLGWSQ